MTDVFQEKIKNNIISNGQRTMDLDPSFSARVQSARLKWGTWTENEFKDLFYIENLVPKELLPTPLKRSEESNGFLGKMKNLICGAESSKANTVILQENEQKKVKNSI